MVVSGYAVGRGACIRIYEAGLGNPLHVIEGRIATSVTWAPDGNRFSSICQSDTKLYVSDAANGTDVLTITCHGNGVNDEAWAPNGKCIVTCGKDSIINAWDASSGTLMWAIPQGEDGAKVDRICCAPDGRLVAGAGSWSKNTNLNIWDGDKGTLLGSAYVGMGGVSAIAADPSGRLIASASFQYTEETSVKLWMLKENLEFRWSVKMESTVCSLAFSPDGLFLAVGVVPGIVHLYDLKSFTEVSGGM
jgi:WD40 repeat protein